MQPYDSIMCGYFCTGFIDFMLKRKSSLDYNNLFSPKIMGRMKNVTKIYVKYMLTKR